MRTQCVGDCVELCPVGYVVELNVHLSKCGIVCGPPGISVLDGTVLGVSWSASGLLTSCHTTLSVVLEVVLSATNIIRFCLRGMIQGEEGFKHQR